MIIFFFNGSLFFNRSLDSAFQDDFNKVLMYTLYFRRFWRYYVLKFANAAKLRKICGIVAA